MNNSIVRTLTGLVFGLIMICGILFNEFAFGALFLVIMLQAMHEFYTISVGDRFRGERLLAYVAATCALTATFCHAALGLDPRWTALSLLPGLTIPVLSIFKKDHRDFADISLIYAALLYIALPVSLVPYLVVRDGFFSGLLLLSLFIIIWTSDIGAYCFGTMLGQKEGARKLAPTISPKKSWWGFWGGVLLGIAVSVALYFLRWIPFNLFHCLAIGIIVSVGGVLGDLVESLWKRHFGVKDSGNCIPGHGGMLDRFDSSLLAIPFASIYMVIFDLL